MSTAPVPLMKLRPSPGSLYVLRARTVSRSREGGERRGGRTGARRCRWTCRPPRAARSTRRAGRATASTRCLRGVRGEPRVERGARTDLHSDEAAALRDLVGLRLHGARVSTTEPARHLSLRNTETHLLNDALHVGHPARLDVARVRAQLARRERRRPEREPAGGRLRVDVWACPTRISALRATGPAAGEGR